MSVFVTAAIDAGLTEDQAKLLEKVFAKKGHHHEIEEINGLEDALEGEDDEDDDEDDDDEEETTG